MDDEIDEEIMSLTTEEIRLRIRHIEEESRLESPYASHGCFALL